MNIKIVAFFFVLFCIALTQAGVGSRSIAVASGSSKYGVNSVAKSSSYKSDSPYHLHGLGNEYEYDRTNPVKKSKEANALPKTGRNISTLQIVMILITILSLGFVGYYLVQFWPFFFSKQSKYDIMGRASVTPTHSREFEYDESTSSATKSTIASINGNEHDV